MIRRVRVLAVLLAACLACARAAPRVAVVGGGVAGASAAHYIRAELGNSADIQV